MRIFLVRASFAGSDALVAVRLDLRISFFVSDDGRFLLVLLLRCRKPEGAMVVDQYNEMKIGGTMKKGFLILER